MKIRLFWQQIPSTLISEALSHSSLDGVVLDLEHSAFNPETAYSCIQIIKLKQKQAFVRIPPGEITLARHALDTGCDGLIFSTVENQRQSKTLLDICHFNPDGGKRGLGLVRDNFWGEQGLPLRKPITIAQIETLKGIEALLRGELKGFNYYLIGPYDLSLSIGCPGQFSNTLFQEAIDNFKKAVKPQRRGFHLVKDFQKDFHDYSNWGFLAFGLDTLMIQQGIKEIEAL